MFMLKSTIYDGFGFNMLPCFEASAEEVAVPVSQRQALDRCLARPSKGRLLGHLGGRCHQVVIPRHFAIEIFPDWLYRAISHSIQISDDISLGGCVYQYNYIDN